MKLFNGILGVFALFASLYCLWFPGLTFLNGGWIVTILLCCWGFCALFEAGTNRKDGKLDKKMVTKGSIALLAGIVAAVLAIISQFNPAAGVAAKIVFVYIFIVWLMISGVMSIMAAISAQREESGSKWIFTLILGIITLLLGVYGASHLLISAHWMTVILGIMLAVYGVRLLASVFE